MSFVIRPATTYDAAAIASVQITTWNSTYKGIVPDDFLSSLTHDSQSTMWLQHLSDPNALIFVAEVETDLVGFITGGPLRDICEDFDAEIYALYVLPHFHRRGIGGGLVRTLAAALSSLAFRNLLVWVLEQNPFICFYQRLGASEQLHRCITLGQAELPEVALGWPHIEALCHPRGVSGSARSFEPGRRTCEP